MTSLPEVGDRVRLVGDSCALGVIERISESRERYPLWPGSVMVGHSPTRTVVVRRLHVRLDNGRGVITIRTGEGIAAADAWEYANEWLAHLPASLQPLGRQILRYYEGADLPEEEWESNGGPGRPTGGNLHITLDDGAWQVDHVRFCLEQARREGDAAGVALAEALLAVDDGARRLLCS